MTAPPASLALSPGTVSQQMASLQRSVGVELFVHVGRRIELTDAGSVLAEHALRILEAERVTKQAVEEVGEKLRAEVRVGVVGTAAASLLRPERATVPGEYAGVTGRSSEGEVDAAEAG